MYCKIKRNKSNFRQKYLLITFKFPEIHANRSYVNLCCVPKNYSFFKRIISDMTLNNSKMYQTFSCGCLIQA